MGNMYPSHLAGGGGGYSGTAQPSDVLTGETFINANGPQTGIMANNGAVSINLTDGQTYTVPEGYHDGTGTVTAPTFNGPDLIVIAKSSYLWFIDVVNGKSIRSLTGTYTVCDNVTLTVVDGATCKFDSNANVTKTADTISTMENVVTDTYTANANYDANATGINYFKFT